MVPDAAPHSRQGVLPARRLPPPPSALLGQLALTPPLPLPALLPRPTLPPPLLLPLARPKQSASAVCLPRGFGPLPRRRHLHPLLPPHPAWPML